MENRVSVTISKKKKVFTLASMMIWIALFFFTLKFVSKTYNVDCRLFYHRDHWIQMIVHMRVDLGKKNGPIGRNVRRNISEWSAFLLHVAFLLYQPIPVHEYIHIKRAREDYIVIFELSSCLYDIFKLFKYVFFVMSVSHHKK